MSNPKAMIPAPSFLVGDLAAVDAMTVFRRPVESLTVPEGAAALAVLKKLDGFLHSKSKTAPGRLDAIIASLKGQLAIGPDAPTADKPREESFSFDNGMKVDVRLSTAGPGKAFDLVAAEQIVTAHGLDDAWETTLTPNPDAICEAHKLGLISPDVFASIMRSSRSISPARLEALAALGKVTPAEKAVIWRETPPTYTLTVK